jgi:hypothetical protein
MDLANRLLMHEKEPEEVEEAAADSYEEVGVVFVLKREVEHNHRRTYKPDLTLTHTKMELLPTTTTTSLLYYMFPTLIILYIPLIHRNQFQP